MSEDKNIKTFYQKLKEKHKLTFVDDSTYHEKWSFNLSALNLISLVLFYTIIIILILFFLIRYTPVKYAFVDNASVYELKELALKHEAKMDSIEHKISSTNTYMNDLKKILKGEDFNDSIYNNALDKSYQPNFDKSSADSLLRYEVEHPEKSTTPIIINDVGFFMSPVKGKVIKALNIENKHYGVDIVTQKDEPILATLEGRIIFSNWTSTEGNVIIIQHHNNVISAYKHCSVILKSLGSKVDIGDPIAIVGNSGEYTTGPHLHFEIWQNGTPLNPQEFITFQ